jgi:hypothetical protein
MVDANLVSATESLAICLALFGWEVGMTILIAVVDVGPAVITVISACTFDAVMETLATKRVKFIGNGIPRTRDRTRRCYRATHEMGHAPFISATNPSR